MKLISYSVWQGDDEDQLDEDLYLERESAKTVGIRLPNRSFCAYFSRTIVDENNCTLNGLSLDMDRTVSTWLRSSGTIGTSPS
jgi:hypothetical protein